MKSNHRQFQLNLDIYWTAVDLFLKLFYYVALATPTTIIFLKTQPTSIQCTLVGIFLMALTVYIHCNFVIVSTTNKLRYGWHAWLAYKWFIAKRWQKLDQTFQLNLPKVNRKEYLRQLRAGKTLWGALSWNEEAVTKINETLMRFALAYHRRAILEQGLTTSTELKQLNLRFFDAWNLAYYFKLPIIGKEWNGLSPSKQYYAIGVLNEFYETKCIKDIDSAMYPKLHLYHYATNNGVFESAREQIISFFIRYQRYTLERLLRAAECLSPYGNIKIVAMLIVYNANLEEIFKHEPLALYLISQAKEACQTYRELIKAIKDLKLNKLNDSDDWLARLKDLVVGDELDELSRVYKQHSAILPPPTEAESQLKQKSTDKYTDLSRGLPYRHDKNPVYQIWLLWLGKNCNIKHNQLRDLAQQIFHQEITIQLPQ